MNPTKFLNATGNLAGATDLKGVRENTLKAFNELLEEVQSLRAELDVLKAKASKE